LLSFYELPLNSTVNIDEIIKHIDSDKKKDAEFLHFVFIKDIGIVKHESISIQELKVTLLKIFN